MSSNGNDNTNTTQAAAAASPLSSTTSSNASTADATGGDAELRDLRRLVATQREKIEELEKQNDKWKRTAAALQTASEQENELISNKLLRRIDELKHEKEKLLLQVEREEEYLTNTLQKQLAQLRSEKVQLEVTLEREQEYAVNRLRRQMQQLQQQSPRMRRLSDADPRREEHLRTALAHEQQVNKQNEELIKMLRVELETEKGKTRMLSARVEQLREASVALQINAEQQEEYISNTLLRRISDLKKEKENLLVQVEQEEEYMTNTLSKKVSQLVSEKRALEMTLDEEREQMVKRLQAQLSSLLASSGESSAEKATQQVSLDAMAEELRSWQQKHATLERAKNAEMDLMRDEIRQLRTDNFTLRQALLRESQKLESMANARIRSTLSVPEELQQQAERPERELPAETADQTAYRRRASSALVAHSPTASTSDAATTAAPTAAAPASASALPRHIVQDAAHASPIITPTTPTNASSFD